MRRDDDVLTHRPPSDDVSSFMHTSFKEQRLDGLDDDIDRTPTSGLAFFAFEDMATHLYDE